MDNNLNARWRGATVSVALCTHNGASYVEEQIISILRQRSPVDELILSDDASIDGTVEIIQKSFDSFVGVNARVPALKVLRNDPPLRVTKNFEQAISVTTGELIILSDQDDVWRSDKSERLAQFFSEHPSKMLAFTNARNVDSEGQYLGHTLFDALELTRSERKLVTHGRAFEAFLRRNLATGATVMFRRELFELAAPFPDAWLHDEWLAIVAAAHDGVGLLDVPLIDYRQHEANQVGMTKMSVAAKFSKFRESRSERNTRLYKRAAQLNNFMRTAPGVSEKYRKMAEEKFQFEAARQRYPAKRIARIPHIFRQLLAGSYHKYGTGAKDALRNLMQPI